MINFIKRLFRKDLTKILSVFDKAQADLQKYIAHTDASAAAAQAAADLHTANATTAKIVAGNLIALTSTAQAVK